MRLYAVITPPPVVLEHLREALGRAALPAAGVARNDAALLSCRLAAFGNLALPDLTIVRDALAEIGGYCPPLALRLAGAEARPTVDRANEVGVGIAGDLDELWSLARAVPPMVKRHGLLLDRRGFHPDIPVVLAARASFHAGALLAALHGYSGPEWVATEMRLVRLIPARVRHPRPRRLRGAGPLPLPGRPCDGRDCAARGRPPGRHRCPVTGRCGSRPDQRSD